MENQVTEEQAIELSKSNFWESMDFRARAGFQLFQTRLCMPFSVFHEALEKSLGRGVFTHEIGLNYEGLCKEFLGESPAPTFQQILEMIPADKRVLVIT